MSMNVVDAGTHGNTLTADSIQDGGYANLAPPNELPHLKPPNGNDAFDRQIKEAEAKRPQELHNQ